MWLINNRLVNGMRIKVAVINCQYCCINPKCSINPTPAGMKNNGIKFNRGDAKGVTWASFIMPDKSKVTKSSIPSMGAGKLPPIKCIANLAISKQPKIMPQLTTSWELVCKNNFNFVIVGSVII